MSKGLLVAAMTITKPLAGAEAEADGDDGDGDGDEFVEFLTPSIISKNSVLSLRMASCSLSDPRFFRMESISSMIIIGGAL